MSARKGSHAVAAATGADATTTTRERQTMTTKKEHGTEQSATLAPYEGTDGRTVSFYEFRGRVCVIAADLGRFYDYAGDGKRIVDLIRDKWSTELEAGRDYDVLAGDDLRAFKAAGGDTYPGWVSSCSRLTILYESGVDIVTQKTEKPEGVRLRRHLADHVLPKLRRGEAVLPSAEAPPVFAPAAVYRPIGAPEGILVDPMTGKEIGRVPVAPSVSPEMQLAVREALAEIMQPMAEAVTQIDGRMAAISTDVAEVKASVAAVREDVGIVAQGVLKVNAGVEALREWLSSSASGRVTLEQVGRFKDAVSKVVDGWLRLGWAQRPTRRSAGKEILGIIYKRARCASIHEMPASEYEAAMDRVSDMQRSVDRAERAAQRRQPATVHVLRPAVSPA